MALKLGTLIIVDLELTCWESKSARPPNEVSEIIEIGLCFFDLHSWQPTSKAQIIVKPTQSTTSKYCTDLTGWTQIELEQKGILFISACNRLTSVYNTKNHPWASWGDYDRLAFERECNRKSITYPFSLTHINLKTIFAIHSGLNKGVGMAEALRKLKLPLVGEHHKGVDDAWNIGRILEIQGRF